MQPFANIKLACACSPSCVPPFCFCGFCLVSLSIHFNVLVVLLYFSVRNGIPTKYGVFVIHVSSGSLAERVGIAVSLLRSLLEPPVRGLHCFSWIVYRSIYFLGGYLCLGIRVVSHSIKLPKTSGAKMQSSIS